MCGCKIGGTKGLKMSTRANIVLQEKGSTLWLYHHFDGYPAYLGKKLMDIMLQHQRDYSDIFDIANEMIKDKEDDDFEITKGQHGDIAYLYLIDIPDKKISCLRPDESLLKSVKYDSATDIPDWYRFCADNI